LMATLNPLALKQIFYPILSLYAIVKFLLVFNHFV